MTFTPRSALALLLVFLAVLCSLAVLIGAAPVGSLAAVDLLALGVIFVAVAVLL